MKKVEIEFLCCKYGGFWNFPKWPDMKIMQLKYIFYGPVLPAKITKLGDDEIIHINIEIKLNNRST